MDGVIGFFVEPVAHLHHGSFGRPFFVAHALQLEVATVGMDGVIGFFVEPVAHLHHGSFGRPLFVAHALQFQIKRRFSKGTGANGAPRHNRSLDEAYALCRSTGRAD
jgi:hypothetical protein